MPRPRKPKTPPPRTRGIERQYARQLRKIARHIGDIVNAFDPYDPAAEPAIRRALDGYAQVIEPWARSQGAQMIHAVNRADLASWNAHSEEMGSLLGRQIQSAPVGVELRGALERQVHYITSLPRDAAQRVHALTVESLETSSRSKQIAEEIKRSGEVSASRATLIARTEVARTASKLTESRARAVGSEGYIWRTAGDTDVRDSHKKMAGKFVRWDENNGEGAHLTDGTTCHAGQIYNCRCYPEPVIPD